MEIKLVFILVSLTTLFGQGQSTFKQQQTASSLVSQKQSQQNQGSLVSVQTTSGLLNGIKENLSSHENNNNILKNGSIYKFLAVPYARAPIGSLRFKRPVELLDQEESMEERFIDASQYGKTCPQYRHLTRFISPLLNIDHEHQTSEDCLHLNVFVPTTIGNLDKSQGNKLEPNKQLPVIVWLPGEGFDFADARQFDGSYLALKTQSIVITVQYRVGVLGFLNAPKLNITGNMGLYDQIAALKWIKRNVLNFGGDSNRITLMGRFSGSMSISALITAPKQELLKTSEGAYLFNRVAMLSGVAVEDWIISRKQAERINDLEKQITKENLCSTINSETNLLDCLQSMPIEQLLTISDYGWRLVVDNELIGSIAPIEAIKRNQFPKELEGVLIGETGQEGTLCLYRHLLQAQENNFAHLIENDKLTTNDVYDIIRDDSLTYFGYNITRTNPIQAALESMVEQQQQASNTLGDINNVAYKHMLRDNYLNACSAFMIKSHSNRFKRNLIARNELSINRMDSRRKPVQVYHYVLNYKPTFSLAPDYIKTAAHGDDIPLIFGLVYGQNAKEFDEADLLMTRKMMSYIGNFVHGYNPILNNNNNQLEGNDMTTASVSNMDSDDLLEQKQNESNQQASSILSLMKRTWTNQAQTNQIEFNERDLAQLNFKVNLKNNKGSDNETNDSATASLPLVANKPNLRVILIDRPQASIVGDNYYQHNNADIKLKTILEVLEALQAGHLAIDSEPAAIMTTTREASPLETAVSTQATSTKSQRLLELHRQQLLEESFWSQQSLRKNSFLPNLQQKSTQSQQQQQQQIGLNSINESFFLTMLMFVACIFIIASCMSLFVGCLAILKYNWNQSSVKGNQRYAATTSSCNICDDSQSNSIDGVLGATRKDARGGFSNVFAKLRNHNNPPQAQQAIATPQQQQQPQCTSASAVGGRQTPTSADTVVLHKAKVDSTTTTTTNGLSNH